MMTTTRTEAAMIALIIWFVAATTTTTVQAVVVAAGTTAAVAGTANRRRVVAVPPSSSSSQQPRPIDTGDDDVVRHRDLQETDDDDDDGTAARIVDIAGIFDATSFEWGGEIFDFTLSLLNDRTDGWHDDVFASDVDEVVGGVNATRQTRIRWHFGDSACDGTAAGKAYWRIRTDTLGGVPPLGIVGARCSSASVAIARISGLEGVPQISPSSTSALLSDKADFPYFSRTVAPDDATGQAGALASLLRYFGWDRVNIITTDTQYSRDLSTQFRGIFEGEVKYSNAVALQQDGTVRLESVEQVLKGAPTDDPRVNSRVVLLLAHEEHAYPILQMAHETGYVHDDTVWVGPMAWVGRTDGVGRPYPVRFFRVNLSRRVPRRRPVQEPARCIPRFCT